MRFAIELTYYTATKRVRIYKQKETLFPLFSASLISHILDKATIYVEQGNQDRWSCVLEEREYGGDGIREREMGYKYRLEIGKTLLVILLNYTVYTI